jgi:DNA-binding CsgD family transcriptional regulator
MSGIHREALIPARERQKSEGEWLVFAAASILTEMSKAPPGSRQIPCREVVSADKRYRLEGHRLHTEPERTGPIVLVFVEALEPAAEGLPGDVVLRQRFGLTRKEARVARLIALDWTNEQIALELSISPHTARHHTERILAKLGVKSRTKVKPLLAP